MKDDRQEFLANRVKEISDSAKNKQLFDLSNQWLTAVTPHRYSYHFDWLGLPIIQFPQDIIAIQEIIWKTKPDIIIETGIARGGSLMLSASILHLLNNNGKVIGIDIDIRKHNKTAIEKHPLFSRISLIEGSSTDIHAFEKIKRLIAPNAVVMVILDSNHTHEHVFDELKLYSTLISKNSYLIVMDTIIEELPDNTYLDRPWGKKNNPKTAVHQFLKENSNFIVDNEIQNKLLITAAPDGYLKRIF